MSQNSNTNGSNYTSSNTNLSLFFQSNNNSSSVDQPPSSLHFTSNANCSNGDIYSPTSPSFPTTPSWCNSTSSIVNNNNNFLSTPTSSGVIYQSLKRKNNKTVVPLDERVTLEKVYGLTVSSNTRLSQSCDGIIAYLAGCVIVLYDPYTQKQDFLISQARKTLTTVAFSPDGRILATGEVNINYIFFLFIGYLISKFLISFRVAMSPK